MARRKLPSHRPIALYLRLSKADLDDADGRELTDEQRRSKGIDRQRVDGLAAARQRHNLPADAVVMLHTEPDANQAGVVLYVEDGESAWKRKRVWITDQYGERRQAWRVVRPVWGQMMRDIRARRFGLAIHYNSDRLARDPYDMEDVIETAEHYGQAWDAASGSFDLTTDDGRTMARMMAVMNKKASDDASRRQKRKQRELAEQGEPRGGPRPFGWKEDRRTLDPMESRELKDAIRRIRTGIAPAVIIREWLERGVRTPKGNPWKWTQFIAMLRNPRLCGYRSRVVLTTRENGAGVRSWEIVTVADGTEVKGKWEPIVTRGEWDDLQSRIGDSPRARDGYDRATANAGRYLLSGMVFCGKCGGKMAGNASKRGSDFYNCPAKVVGGCGGGGRSMPKVDEFVGVLALRLHAEGTGDREAVGEDEALIEAELDRIDGLLGDALAAWKSRQIPSKAYFVLRADLERDRAEIEARRRSIARSASVSDLDEIARRWPDATVAEKRAFVQTYLSGVVIHPIEPVWDEKKKRMVRPWKFNPALIEPIRRQRPRAAS